ncbi:hypothetical protein [Virgisporangium ochraceum]|uniref:hypothetical protein n=1 Tax=Virgisporangium ochraceum TaxID=65505 RepID=UPI0019458F82|nr:hypothetical protein [Virgisporangium ochraceum]
MTGIANRLHGLALRLIVVDLTTVTYVGSTFVTFLAALREGHPDSQLVLHNPSMLARTVIAATGMDRHLMINIHPEPPAGSAGPDAAVMTIVPLGAGYPITGAAGWIGAR